MTANIPTIEIPFTPCHGDSINAPRPTGPSVFVPMRLGRRSGRKVILNPSNPERRDANPSRLENPLVSALARGYRLQTMLDQGEFDSHTALAQHLGWSRSYTSRMVRLALLAPDIVEAILDGREPSGFSITTLFNTDLPDDWPGQRRVLGFPAVE